eukprot:scaffold17217_cov134-Isochrysis_galbana.AAC.2
MSCGEDVANQFNCLALITLAFVHNRVKENGVPLGAHVPQLIDQVVVALPQLRDVIPGVGQLVLRPLQPYLQLNEGGL